MSDAFQRLFSGMSRRAASRRLRRPQLAIEQVIAKRLTDQQSAHRPFTVDGGDAQRREGLAGIVAPHCLDARRRLPVEAETQHQRRRGR